jgi:hypothetical protein
MEQGTIFDETFSEKINVRRRSIMPVGLQFYMWAAMVIGSVTILSFFFNIFSFFGDGEVLDTYFILGRLIGSIIPGVMVFLMGYLLWIEVKWAVRYNWGVLILLLGLVAITVISAGIQGLSVGGPGVFFIPFWVLLYRIQKKWERGAVSGRELKARG